MLLLFLQILLYASYTYFFTVKLILNLQTPAVHCMTNTRGKFANSNQVNIPAPLEIGPVFLIAAQT